MKVPGFTTLELSVAMVLAALVTGIGYSGYTLFLKQWNTYNKNLDEAMDLRNFQSLLYRDFYVCESIEKQEDVLKVNYKNEQSVLYHVSTTDIIRQQNEATDTFKFPVLLTRFEFEGNEQFLPGGKVDRFEIELEYKKQPLHMVYAKEYGRGDLMEWSNEHRYQ